jgi:hypothetical protein
MQFRQVLACNCTRASNIVQILHTHLTSSWQLACIKWQSALTPHSVLGEHELIFRQASKDLESYLVLLFPFHLTTPFYLHRL